MDCRLSRYAASASHVYVRFGSRGGPGVNAISSPLRSRRPLTRRARPKHLVGLKSERRDCPMRSLAVIASRLARVRFTPNSGHSSGQLECPLRARNRLPPIAALVGDRYSIFGDTAESTLYAASGRRIPLSANHPPARRSRYSQPPSARGG
jgi:hypothetical protein